MELRRDRGLDRPDDEGHGASQVCADPPEDTTVRYRTGGRRQGRHTDRGGATRFVVLPARCGRATLVVAKQGYRPHTMAVETCRSTTVTVKLEITGV